MLHSIRKAEEHHLAGLSDLFVEFIDAESNLTAMKKQLDLISTNSDYYIAVACDDKEKVIGTSMAIKCMDLVGNCKPFLVVENVVVAPGYRGMGIGKSLMEAVEEFGLQNDCNYIMLVSGNSWSQAHDFYRSIGYSDEHAGFKKRLIYS
ncbi:GNAT family N-acetyltransferase [Cohnella lupini]|uniref:Acetyltransferase (GNAT) family protein n=1 Tax=Cohnella lupini TaxID=1294267 RepID=A0A3D9IWH4_9BACL|nr:GNAT family N-acetyltransferase [Cohnella lupini]RED66193.1 acetyltransferase (GNAT) family protein [Cohnella lupini]